MNIRESAMTIGIDIKITFQAFPISAIFPAIEVDEMAELIYVWILSEVGMQTGPSAKLSYICTAFSLSALLTG